ncbi:MAG: 2-nitropropane dioxygenase [Armatimonadetes bacterium 55-13]|nr:nitronate monooxygenase [Armatimonadota bacterium]OJU62132.1 MAG: 2-nitropropane dioxygenase [Armatimonadetes bacterium 55-13]
MRIYPKIIQGGMGIAVSSWPLAAAVARRGQMGVVSSSGLDLVLARRLQLGDIGGRLREALDQFPIRSVAERVLARYFIPGGKAPDAPFRSKPLPSIRPSQAILELMVVANFAEVFLAKQGHSGPIGINLLEKIQLPTLPSLYGAMLAGVDFVLMGAGIPRAIPEILDRLARLERVELKLDVVGAQASEVFTTTFMPQEFGPPDIGSLKRPEFLAIVSSSTLAATLAKKCTGRVDGFVVEGKTAGGHNAPPRGELTLDETGQPVYGPRDIPNLDQIRELGLPFWFAGSFGSPEKLRQALDLGAQGIQIGTAFAFCNESGISPDIKARTIRRCIERRAEVFTDPQASPTGFPFKVLELEGTLSESLVYESRQRVCDLGYLRELYRKEDGTVGYRCSGEPIDDFVRKGGDPAKTAGRKCICNGLLASIDLGQVRNQGPEPALVTAGDDVSNLTRFLRSGQSSYSADDVVDFVLSGSTQELAP